MLGRKRGALLLALCLAAGSLTGCGGAADGNRLESVSGQENMSESGESSGESTDFRKTDGDEQSQGTGGQNQGDQGQGADDQGQNEQNQADQGQGADEQGQNEQNQANQGQGGDESQVELHDPTAQEIMDDILVGWNLGNCLDSHTRENEGLRSETAWGNPAATKELIDLVKSTGVNLVRVPVTWYNHMDSGSYEIDGEWMDRVEEVVNYVLDNDMYCIINVHHDTGAEGWLRASRTNLEENRKKFAAIWEQICERFGEYGDKLLFEGFNEILDDNSTWNTPGKEAVEVTNELNQLFVDTVRASGGNNAARCLILNTYCAGGNSEATKGFVMPEDSVADKLIVEAHIYQPYYFVFGMSQTWKSSKNALDSCLKNMSDSFVKKGIPVLIGEFGCVDSRSDLERQTWLQYYMDTCCSYGLKCVWWDNGSEWKIINRKTMKIAEPELFEIMLTEARGGDYTVDAEKPKQEAEGGDNLCADDSKWSVYVNTGNGADGKTTYIENGIQLTAEKKGSNTWDLQISYTGLTLEKDAVYQISFDYTGSPGQDMEFHFMQNYEDYQTYATKTLSYREETQHYEGEFRMTEKTDSNARITFDCGASRLDGTYSITIENLTLIKTP